MEGRAEQADRVFGRSGGEGGTRRPSQRVLRSETSTWLGSPGSPPCRRQGTLDPPPSLPRTGRPLPEKEKQPCLGAHLAAPPGPGIGFQEHSITCLGQSPGEGAVYPSLPVSSPFYWLLTKKLLTFLKASEYTVHLCGVGGAGTNRLLN